MGQPSPSVPGETMGESGPLLYWSFPSLQPGVYQLPYTVTVPTTLTAQTVLINNAQVGFSGGRPQSVTAPVTVVFPMTVQVAVYNSAGELVKILLVKNFSQAIGTFQLSSALLTNQDSSTAVSILGAAIVSWDGTTQNGTPVTNGQYFIKIQSTDPYGAVTSVTQTVGVNRSLATLSVAVYNEAGEVVKNLFSQTVVSGGTNTIQSLQLSSTVIQPGPGTQSNPAVTAIQVAAAGGGVTLAWDGTNNQGTVVSNGQYYVEVHLVDGQGGENQTITRQVAVLNGGRGTTPGPLVVEPNVLSTGQSAAVFTLNTAQGFTLKVRVYDVAGELVGSALGPAEADRVVWNAGGAASGLYIAVVDVEGPNGHAGSKTAKLLVRH